MPPLFKKIVRKLWFLLQALIIPFRVLFFLANNYQEIFKNRIVYPFYCNSFGHNIISFELVTRLTHPHRVSVIYTPWIRFNPYLPLLYHSSADIFYFNAPHELRDFTWRVMRIFLTFLTSIRMDAERSVVYDYEALCNLLNFGIRDIAGHEKLGKLYEIRNTRGFHYAVQQGLGVKPALPEQERVKCREAILAAYPDFFDRPLITVLLRMKGADGPQFSDRIRCASDMITYVPAMEYLAAEGFHIAGTGETDSNLFAHIKGYHDLEKINLDPKLLNIFLLTECNIFLGQQSGPYYLLHSRGIQCILTNCMPYRMGSLGAKDLNLYKKIFIGGKEISAASLYKDHQDLVRGYHFAEKEAEVRDNSAEDILETIKEAVSLYRNETISPEIEALDRKLRNLMLDDMRVKHDPSRMPGFILKSLKPELN